jgi:hypothetical protein
MRRYIESALIKFVDHREICEEASILRDDLKFFSLYISRNNRTKFRIKPRLDRAYNEHLITWFTPIENYTYEYLLIYRACNAITEEIYRDRVTPEVIEAVRVLRKYFNPTDLEDGVKGDDVITGGSDSCNVSNEVGLKLSKMVTPVKWDNCRQCPHFKVEPRTGFCELDRKVKDCELHEK